MTNNDLFHLVATGSSKGKQLILSRVPCKPGDDDFPLSGFEKTCFSVLVCFTITTNKAQDQSFGGATGFDLIHKCFTHGQLFVAMSTIARPSNICVLTKLDYNTATDEVYKTVLSTC